VVGNGLPDEARAGRLLLKDYCSGKLTFYERPPGHEQGSTAGATESAAAPATSNDDESSSGEREGIPFVTVLPGPVYQSMLTSLSTFKLEPCRKLEVS
jgi:large subunit GTPase 1